MPARSPRSPTSAWRLPAATLRGGFIEGVGTEAAGALGDSRGPAAGHPYPRSGTASPSAWPVLPADSGDPIVGLIRKARALVAYPTIALPLPNCAASATAGRRRVGARHHGQSRGQHPCGGEERARCPAASPPALPGWPEHREYQHGRRQRRSDDAVLRRCRSGRPRSSCPHPR